MKSCAVQGFIEKRLRILNLHFGDDFEVSAWCAREAALARDGEERREIAEDFARHDGIRSGGELSESNQIKHVR